MERLRNLLPTFPAISPELGKRRRELVLKLIEREYQLSVFDLFRCLNEIRRIAQKNPYLNLIVYFNHISLDDPVFILWLYFRYIDPDKKRRIILPASHWHTNFSHNPKFTLAYHLGRALLGYEGVRIIQAYQLREQGKYPYDEKQALRTYREFLERIGENPKNTSLVISPEGHRSEDGALQQGEKGIVYLTKHLFPCVLLPVGIVYPESFKRNELNLGAKVNLIVGQPLYPQDRKTGMTLEQIMTSLALTLPEEMRGVYRDCQNRFNSL